MQKAILTIMAGFILAGFFLAGCAHGPAMSAAEKGDVAAQFALARKYETGGDGVEPDMAMAAKWYEKAAMQASTGAQNNLGLLYERGDGVPQDYVKAFYWLLRAAEMGNSDAEYNLAELYVKGYGTPQDYLKAAEWFGKAGMQGNAAAQDELSTMYYEGRGITQNFRKAYTWAALAATGNADDAARRRDHAASHLSHDDLLQAQQESTALFAQIHPSKN